MGAVVKLTVKSDFDQASADLKKFGTISEAEAKKIEKFTKSFKSEQIDKFEDRTRRATAAVKATRGPIEAVQLETRKYRSEIEKLIRKGLDPQGDEIKRLTTRYKQLEREIEDVNKAQKTTTKSFNFTEAAITSVGFAAASLGSRAVDEIIDFTAAALDAASAAEEIEGKFGVVFGSISGDAEAAAATIADDFDLAISTVNKLLGDTGDILTGVGFDQDIALELSEQVGTLALDLASFTNFAGGAEGASAALTKALLGEAESAKALGIVIRQDTKEYQNLVDGIIESEKVTLVQAKALAALQIATEQSANAIGDYARTAESTANVQRTLDEQIKRSKEVWGDYLNEGITPVRSALRDYLKEINDIKVENNAVNASFEGQIENLDLAISGTRKLIENQKEAIKTASSLAGFDIEGAEKALNLTEARLEGLIRLEASRKRSLQATKDEQKAADETEKLEQERFNALLESEDLIEKRRVDSLTSGEKQIEQVQASIDKWSEFRDVVGVQELLNDLIKERSELLVETAEAARKLALQELNDAADLIQAERDRKKEMEEFHRSRQERVWESLDTNEQAAAQTQSVWADTITFLKENWQDLSFSIVDGFTNLFSALDQLNQAMLEKQLALIDQRMMAELDAAGLLEETERERLNNELQAAFAAGDTALIKEKQDALDRLSIVEKFEKEKANAEFKASLASWRLQLAGAIASGAAAVAKTLASVPFPFNLPLAGLQAAASGIQVTAVAKAKPQPPAFAEGGSFRTSGPQTITVGDNVGGEEDVTVNPVSSTGFNTAAGGGLNGMKMKLVIGEEEFEAFLIESTQDAIDNQELRRASGGEI